MLGKILKAFWNDLKRFQFLTNVKAFICSFLNLIIYLIIILMILGLDQGHVFQVALFENGNVWVRLWNIILFHGLLYYLAYIMSIYPTYIHTILFSGQVDSAMGTVKATDRVIFKRTRTGLIYFEKLIGAKSYCYPESETSDVIDDTDQEDDMAFWKLKFLEGAVRKFLAVGLFTTWSWLILTTFLKFQVDYSGWQIWMIKIVMIGFSLLMGYFFWRVTIKLKRDMDSSISKEKYIAEIQKFVKYRALPIGFFGGMFLVVALLQKWSGFTVALQVLFCAYLSIDLMIIRTLRKYIKPSCNTIIFLNRIRNGFILIVILLFAFNFWDVFTMSTNPINVAICGIIVLYYVITFILKMYLYVKYGSKNHNRAFYKTSLFYFWSIVGLMTFAFVMTWVGNDLHNLKLIPRSDNQISLDELYSKHESVKTADQSILYAAYGGGLKAHYWNLLILDEVEKRDEMKNILAMSGVSGGGMGISSHTIMNYIDANTIEDRRAYRNSLRSSNVLSLELGYYFGSDMIRNWMPSGTYFLGDRSNRSMNFYAQLFGDKDLVNNTTFDNVYHKIFSDRYYPNIIINSTTPNNQYGVAAAVREVDYGVYSTKKNIYPGAINILDIQREDKKLTLNFLEAASTCNRFPIISPTADIENKGTFVDGGYYENSGLMSLLSFKYAVDELKSADTSYSKKMKLVSVTNNKMNYLQSIVRDLLSAEGKDGLVGNQFILKSNKDYAGLWAVIKSGTNKDRSPEYFRTVIERYRRDDIAMLYIDLPYHIDEDYLKEYFDGCLIDATYDLVWEAVQESNEEIKSLLAQSNNEYDLRKWGVMNPPTARILSRPVELYMEIMIEHPNVKKQLTAAFR